MPEATVATTAAVASLASGGRRDALDQLGKGATRPLRLGVYWMMGTFGGYLAIGDKGSVALVLLTTFVGLATLAWAVGYRWGVRSFPFDDPRVRSAGPGRNDRRNVRYARRWVWASGIYFILYGYSLLVAYGATPASYLEVIRNPGRAYAAKFELVEGLSTQTGNTLLQALILLSLLQLPLGPMMGFFWTELSLRARAAAIMGFLTYVGYFLYIGTLQGLGFLLIGVIAGVLARQTWQARAVTKRKLSRARRRARLVISVGLAVFTIYMANALSERLEVFDVHNKYLANPVVASVVGEDFARGLAVVAHYPTHGYRGLALDLERPFVWTEGRGSSRAIDSYWEQYFGNSVFENTYPARNETVTGYSATIHWSTVYPWLASDLTFPGVIALMLLLGRWTASMWLRTVLFRDPIALMLFSQLALFIAFISVNNQVLISRPSLLAVVSCVMLYCGREFKRKMEIRPFRVGRLTA